jgi:hypothetical protein
MKAKMDRKKNREKRSRRKNLQQTSYDDYVWEHTRDIYESPAEFALRTWWIWAIWLGILAVVTISLFGK